MRIASWGRSAADVMYILAALGDVRSAKVISKDTSFDDGESTIYLKAEWLVAEKGRPTKFRFEGNHTFRGVPNREQIKDEFQKKFLTGEDQDGDPITMKAPVELWNSILTDRLCSELIDDLNRKSSSFALPKVPTESGKPARAAVLEYDLVKNDRGRPVLDYKISGLYPKARIVRMAPSGSPSASPRYKSAPLTENIINRYQDKPQFSTVPKRTTRTPHEVRPEWFMLDGNGYVDLDSKPPQDGQEYKLSELPGLFNDVQARHLGSLGETPLNIGKDFWTDFFADRSTIANRLLTELNRAWRGRTKTKEEVEDSRARAEAYLNRLTQPSPKPPKRDLREYVTEGGGDKFERKLGY
jgi:hypothetical protein